MGVLALSLDFPRMANDNVDDFFIFLSVLRGGSQGY
jgi:hypothetical protein